MKVQTGIRIESEAWQNYKLICKKEKVHPAQPIEDFLRSVIDNDSAHGILISNAVAKMTNIKTTLK